MRLRKKILTIILSLSIVLITSIYILSQLFLIPGIVETERKEITDKLLFIEKAIKLKIRDLDRLNNDWSAWDDTYNFIIEQNNDYIKSNLVDETFANLNINIIVISDTSHNIVFSKYYNSLNKISLSPIPEKMLALNKFRTQILTNNKLSGIALFNNLPIIFITKPVLNSAFSGPERGAFLVGRALDSTFIKEVSAFIGVKFTYSPYSLRKVELINSAPGCFLQEIDNSNIKAFYEVKDINNHSTGTIKAIFKRNTLLYQLDILNKFLIGLFILGFIQALLANGIIKHTVINKILHLKNQVEKIGFTKNLQNPISIKGKDEITELADSMNETFFELEQSHIFNEIARKQINMQIAALESIILSVVITDIDGNIIWFNKAFTELTGFPREEILGKGMSILKSGIQDADFYKSMKSIIKEGKIWKGCLVNRRYNGSLYNEEMSIIPVVEENIIKYYVVIKEDITSRIEYEKAIIKAKEEAEKSDLLKSEFLAQMSHEIRTPLNTVLNFISLIKLDLTGNLTADMETSFEMIDNGSRRLIRTIDLILDMSMLNSGVVKVNLENVSPFYDIIQRLYYEKHEEAENKHLNFLVENKLPDDFYLKSDIYILTQMIENLIDNAIKFTYKGFVKIILSYFDEDTLLIEIDDSGIGISEEFQRKLFTPFSQEEQGYTRRFEGNGLGLSLVKKYSNLLNARIEFESKKDVGTKFKIFLKIET